jgi:hypothetical protein
MPLQQAKFALQPLAPFGRHASTHWLLVHCCPAWQSEFWQHWPGSRHSPLQTIHVEEQQISSPMHWP